MELDKVKVWLRVVKKLGDTKGMFIKKKHLDVRAICINGTVGLYAFDEFDPIDRE